MRSTIVLTCDRSGCLEILWTEKNETFAAFGRAAEVGWAVCPTGTYHRTYCPKHRPGRRLFDRKGAR